MPGNAASKVKLYQGGAPLCFSQFMEQMEASQPFRTFLTQSILDAPYRAFFWETPPVMAGTMDPEFEFVQTDAPILAATVPDPEPFSSQFVTHSAETVLSFPNLGGDAILVVPKPLNQSSCYAHLASFLRGGPAHQIDDFWRAAVVALRHRLAHSHGPCWLSTAGLGVSWLHLRLDSQPKYYRYTPYKASPRSA